MATTVSTKTTTGCPSNLCERHYQEFLSSGISQSIIEKNFRTINDAREIDELLNRNTKSRSKHSEHLVPAWAVTGIDPKGWERHVRCVQVKRDFSEVCKDGKPKKYLGATDYDAAPLFLETDDPDYWHKVYEDLSIPLFITEGAKKAAAALSILLACISIPGVSTCRKLGRLHEKIRMFCKFGRTIYLAFDNDVMQKQSVQQALIAMGRDIAALGAKVMVIQLPPGEAKGMDDFIAQHGEEEFKKLVDSALTIEEWREQLQKNWETEQICKDDTKTKSQKYPPADELAIELGEKYQDKFRYNSEHKSWMEYEFKSAGVWKPVEDIVIECHIQTLLKARGITGYGTDSYIQNICKFLRRELIVYEWNERENILPFLDGVVDIATGKFEEHSPENLLTWSLPRKYALDVVTDWGNIRNWLFEAWSDEADREAILCFFSAVIRGRYDLQKFLYLVGTGGSGKGTLTRLLEVILGERNTWAGKIENLADKNDCARLVGKRLAVFADQDKVIGGMQLFKNLTGQDKLAAKRLYKDGFDFTFSGLALITANAPALLGAASWIKRRALVINCQYQPEVERNLEAEFEPEIAAFTRYLLTISNEQIDRVLKHNRPTNGKATPAFWDMAQRQDSIAAWLEECVKFDEKAFTQVGKNKDEWRDRDYNPDLSTLFGSYHYYCRSTGLQGKSLNNFAPELEEICQKVLGYKFVGRERNSSGIRGFRGLRLRCEVDLRISDNLLITANNPTDNLTDNLDSLHSKDSDNPDNLIEKNNLNKNSSGEETNNDGASPDSQTIVKGRQSCQPVSQDDAAARNVESDNPDGGCPSVGSRNEAADHSGGRNTDLKALGGEPISQQIATLWNNTFALGQLILVLAAAGQLATSVSEFTPEQIKHIKEAANTAWKPNCTSKGDYQGEKVELFEFGNTGRWKVRLSTGGIISVSRTQVYPWLDFE